MHTKVKSVSWSMPDIFEWLAVCAYIHLSPTPRLFSILCGGQRGSMGPQGDQKAEWWRARFLSALESQQRADISKWNPHLIRQGITSLRRNAFCILVLVLLTTVCSRLSQTAAAPKRLRSSWYLLAAPLWLPLTPPEVPRCLAPSLPSSQPALLDASTLKPSPALLSSPLEGCTTRQEQNFQALHWEIKETSEALLEIL